MWLENLILRKAERRLAPYREQIKSLDESIHEKYQAQLPEIIQLYQQASHWHGTGRYHYAHGHQTRYDQIDVARTIDVLESIILADGLQTYKDIWIDSGQETVSLSKSRMYAKIYATVHRHEDEEFIYDLGSVMFWIHFYFVLTIPWLFELRNMQALFRIFRHCSPTKNMRRWAGAIRHPTKCERLSLLDVLRGNVPGSDLEGNYPVLFGLKPAEEDLLPHVPINDKIESRSLKLVRLDRFTHIEVPMQHVEETKKLLRRHNLSLAIVPLEFGDMYLADRPLRDLAFS